MDFIEGHLAEADIRCTPFIHNNVRSLFVLPENRIVQVLLISHIDVVDGPEVLFEPRIRGNNLYGRGSIDDKYAVAISIVLLQSYLTRIRRQGLDQNDLPFGILITSDEEIGGHNGAKPALETVFADFHIFLDGGNVHKIVTQEKGLIQCKLVCRGKAAHGARPWRGENAIETLMADYRKTQTLFSSSEPGNWHRTVSICAIRGGTSPNQVPDYAEAKLDIRYTENDDPLWLLDAIKNRIRGRLEEARIEPLFHCGPTPYLDLLMELSADTHTGREHGASDARFLTARGLSGVVWGADGDLSQHSENEHVNIESIAVLFDRLSTFLYRITEIKLSAS